MNILQAKKGFICDMDGVIYKGDYLLPGVKDFVNWLQKENKQFLFLTNNSSKTPQDLQNKLLGMGLEVNEEHFYTSALATAKFLKHQSPGASAYIIGGPGLFTALEEAGIVFNDINPDYVVFGETNDYKYEHICRAMHHVLNGARLIGTNSDLTGPSEHGIIPACRALVAPIEMTTGKKAYFVGKPNPLMMRTGLQILGIHSEETAMIGDRMDTDIIAGIESGLDSILVLTGVTSREDISKYPYRPRLVLENVGEIAKNSL
ncbi:MAG TPA: HAD family hydrolase [Candidatus Avacidaminococcus intestinavium]|uniref:Acid sugar phosphatase n=1 Tax=Candidatus Avacidaminococcus intestinavium TaxID=2840684 RepID=A0A9D1MPP9_9FIRM|nr:HAD family hydrolase [Candidatus Avacidaminococcus intestinavium]